MTPADAQAEGRKAFEDGRPAGPMLNPPFFERVLDARTQGADFCELLRAYARGWDRANLAAPLPPELAADLERDR